jgi:hypothetical protein
VLSSWGKKALIRNRRALRVYDAEQRSAAKLDVELARLPDLVLGGRFVFVSPALVDLERGELVATSPLRPQALSSSGLLLVAEGGAASAERLARGPLRWLDLTQAR